MLVGIFGILKAGASYIPLDGGIVTDNMLQFVLNDSNAAIIAHSATYSHRIPPQFKSICVTECIENQKVERNQRCPPFTFFAQDNMPNDEAYVIYTSGKCRISGLPVRSFNIMYPTLQVLLGFLKASA
jgi:non-ribosomal peptide synthetase component F